MSENSTDTAQIRSLNRWLIVLISFIALWTVGIFLYVHQQAEEIKKMPSIVMIDSSTGKITNASYSNLFPAPIVSTNLDKTIHPLYEQRASYEIKDFVIINYFFIEGIVVDKQGNDYTVMYKDHDRVLQKITVPKEFLLTPSEDVPVNPAALLAP